MPDDLAAVLEEAWQRGELHVQYDMPHVGLFTFNLRACTQYSDANHIGDHTFCWFVLMLSCNII